MANIVVDRRPKIMQYSSRVASGPVNPNANFGIPGILWPNRMPTDKKVNVSTVLNSLLFFLGSVRLFEAGTPISKDLFSAVL